MMMNKPANWDSVEAITGEYKKITCWWLCM